MARWRFPAAAILTCTTLVCSVSPLFAQTAVLPAPADTSETRELQVAFASSPTQSTLWFSARIYGASDRVFAVIPAPPGAAIDVASDAWFEALRDATNPRVLPPSQKAPSCGSVAAPFEGTFDLVGVSDHVATLEPSSDVTTKTFSQIVVWAQGQGLDLPFDAMSSLADLDVEGYRFVTVPFDPPAGETVLRTMRVSGLGGELRVPLLLSRAGATPVQTSVWILAQGKAVPTGWAAIDLDPAAMSWNLSGQGAKTNYRQRWDEGWKAASGAAWVMDVASHGLLFSTTAFASGKQSVPSVPSAYLSRTAAYGDGDAQYGSCVSRLESLGTSKVRVGRACGAGGIASIPPAAGQLSCEEQALAGETPASSLRCGAGAGDLAMAYAGMVPAEIWLTRWSGRIAPWTSHAQETFEVAAGLPKSPVVVCGAWDSSACPSGADAGAGTGGAQGSDGGGQPSSGAGGYYGGGYGNQGGGPADPGTEPATEDSYAGSSNSVYVESSCWGNSTSAAQDGTSSACAGDSSACSGDSSASGTDSTACGSSSDTGSSSACGGSSSSSSSKDACGGDSSGDKSACDGGSSSSSGGESCSGSGSSGSSGATACGGSSSSSDCSVGRRGTGGQRGKLPMSALTVLIAVCLWPLRRARREAEQRRQG